MSGSFRIEGHAIVSEDGMIADSSGLMPNSLKFQSDQRVYEAALDAAALIVNGRLSYEGQAKSPLRKRLVVTRSVAGLEPDPDNPNARLWNPAGADLDAACASLGVPAGLVAVIGGTFVFSLFLKIGYDAFHLSHAPNVRLPGGVPAFREQEDGHSPEEVLAGAGLRAGAPRVFPDGVRIVEWTRGP